MGNVKQSISIHVPHEPVIDILWYCDDESGYGVEVISESDGLLDFEFGDNSDALYRLSGMWYDTLGVLVDQSDDVAELIHSLGQLSMDDDFADFKAIIENTLDMSEYLEGA